jgi:hypothetical protein
MGDPKKEDYIHETGEGYHDAEETIYAEMTRTKGANVSRRRGDFKRRSSRAKVLR